MDTDTYGAVIRRSLERMALTTCKDCGGSVSTDAKACPKCGRVVRKPVSLSRVVGLLLLVLMVIGYFLAQDYERKAGHGALDRTPRTFSA